MDIRKNDNIKLILLVIAIVPFFGFAGLTNIFGENFVHLYLLFSTAILFFLQVSKNTHYTDRFAIFYILYLIETFTITVIRQGLSVGVLISIFAYLALLSLIISDFDITLRAISIIGYFCIFFNFITLLFLKRGEETIYFIGGKNRFSIILIPLCLIMLLSDMRKYGRIRTFTLINWGIALFSIFLAGSSTGAVVAIMGLVLWLFLKNISTGKLSTIPIFLIIIMFYIILIFFSSTLLESSFWIKLTGLLGKRSDLTDRTIVWKQLLNMLTSNMNNLLFGLGIDNKISFINSWHIHATLTEAHNMLLEIIMDGGIIGLILYIISFVNAIKFLSFRNIQEKIVLIGLILIFVNGLTESVSKIFTSMLFLAITNEISFEGYMKENIRELSDGEINDE